VQCLVTLKAQVHKLKIWIVNDIFYSHLVFRKDRTILNIVLICSLVSQRAVDSDGAESSGLNSFYALFIFLQHLKDLTRIPLCQ
jgi:hypothetical protein